MDKKLEQGQWVRWENPEGVVNFGAISGLPINRKDGVMVYPIKTIDGNKTAVGHDKLEKVPHMRKDGAISKKKERELRKEMQTTRNARKSNNTDTENLKHEVEVLRKKLADSERIKEELRKEKESLANVVETNANSFSSINEKDVIESLKSSVEQCLTNNNLNYIIPILNLLYKIAGI